MTFWLVRAGKHGEQEEGALENNIVTIGWNDLPNLSKIETKERLATLYTETYDPKKKSHVSAVTGQIWSFLKRINRGDLVALPLKRKSGIIIGEITGDYEFKEIQSNIKHTRKIKWLQTFPRSSFDQDILFSLGAFLTVGKVRIEDAETRVRSMLKGEIQPPLEPPDLDPDLDPDLNRDLEQYSKDNIVKFLEKRFAGHNLTRLVDEILKTEGYYTRISPPGPDEGVDILAGSGPLGFGSPRMCVQVKSSRTPADVKIVRELEGVVKSFKAEHGLLVSWGGISSTAEKEMSRSFFSMRLWDQDKIVEEILKNYEKLGDSVKAELPLKKIWILVEESDE